MKKIEKAYFWPLWFVKSLKTNQKEKIDNKLIKKLQTANLYLWRALNIYDDFLDESGKGEELPIANNYYRNFIEIYYNLKLENNFYKIFNEILSSLDKANQDEVRNCHLEIKNKEIDAKTILPKLSPLDQLANKSLALALGPVAICYYLKPKQDDNSAQNILNFFRYALSAKQLADDAKDCFTDLEQGFITKANIRIIQTARRLKLKLRLDSSLPYLLFNQNVSLAISYDLKYLCQQTRQRAQVAEIKMNSPLITEIILPIEQSLTKVDRFRSNMKLNTKIMI